MSPRGSAPGSVPGTAQADIAQADTVQADTVQAAASAAAELAAVHHHLAITGMTCASCAARIERKLNRLDGVAATVNYATETASIRVEAGGRQLGELLDAVRRTGYDARPAAEPGRPASPPGAPGAAVEHPGPADGPGPATDDRPRADPVAEDGPASLSALRRRLLVSALLALPVVLIAMVPPLRDAGLRGMDGVDAMSGMSGPRVGVPWLLWLSLLLALPVVGYGGLPFHRVALRAARHG